VSVTLILACGKLVARDSMVSKTTVETFPCGVADGNGLLVVGVTPVIGSNFWT
jgi:hypothetical protein